MAIQYLSLTGLTQYDAQIKSFVNAQVAAGDEKSFKYVNLVDGVLKFYTVNPISEDTVAAYEVELPEQDLSHLMLLVENAVNGNIAVFGDGGQVVDSGVALSDLATKEEVESAKEEVQSSVDELAALVGELPEGTTATSVVDYVNVKTAGIATDAALEELNNQVAGLQTAVQGIQADYLVEADKTELQGSIDENASAIAAIKEDVDAFFKDADMTESAKDTLKELQEYIASDESGASAMAASIKQNSDNIEALQKDLDAAEELLASKAAQADLDAEIERAQAAEAKALEDAKAYADTEVGKDRARLDALEAADIAMEARVKANEDAIAAINDESTGILKQAQGYADSEIDKVEAVIGAVAEGKTVVEMISDAQAAATYDDSEVKADIEENASAITTLSETHTTDKATLQGNIDAVAGDLEELEKSLVAISEEEINNLFA